MAQKRMFDKRVVDSDKFADLPNSSKALYFMAGMSADDRGFFQPRKLQREYGFSDDDFKILMAKGYFISFESGVMVVTDWNKNNWLDNRRITETEYIDELNLLRLVNQKYELESNCLANAKPVLSQYSIEENSIDKNSIEEDNIEKENIKRKSEKDHFEEIIDNYTDNPEFKEAINEFIKMRKSIKKPLTENALKRTLKKLDQLSNDELIQIKILQQSVDYCWQGIFELQDNKNKNQKRNGMDDLKEIWEEMKTYD